MSGEQHDEAMRRVMAVIEAADARVLPWQANVKSGAYFATTTPAGLVMYGEILIDDSQRPTEFQHYRCCRAHSTAIPDGGEGAIHVSVIERMLSQAEFEAARQRGWTP